jgi:hypothetical protein
VRLIWVKPGRAAKIYLRIRQPLIGGAMRANVGSIDRVLRVAVGVTLISLAILGKLGPWAYIGIVPLLTGLVSWCPAYRLLGFDTCSSRRRSDAGPGSAASDRARAPGRASRRRAART